MNDFIDLGGGMTPRPKENPDIILNAGVAPKIMSNSRFKKLLEKVKAVGKLDREDFSSGKELGQFIDFYNQTEESKKEKDFSDNVLEITKGLVRQMFTKTFFIKPPKK